MLFCRVTEDVETDHIHDAQLGTIHHCRLVGLEQSQQGLNIQRRVIVENSEGFAD